MISSDIILAESYMGPPTKDTGPARLVVLRRAVRDLGGEWTTSRVLRLYRDHGLDVPCRSTARGDLTRLEREGLLIARGPENGRFYVRNHAGGGR